MKKTLGLVVLLIVLGGCSRNVDGLYSATSSSMLGLVQTRMLLAIEKNPTDGLVFHIQNNGNTLECRECEQTNIPRVGERRT